ncbi:bestrophin family protein [Myxococcus sp. CA027]|uniref:bestrophin family protein n=1 Tax=Myxococcus sp. CA027 TaxID=2651866 RepID=UPI001E2D3318|nr:MULTISPECIES: bestrophin family protein [Myxococcus]
MVRRALQPLLLRQIGTCPLCNRTISPRAPPEITWSELRTRVHGMMNVLAACERIRFTPLPFTYTVLLHRTAYLFCLLLPFGLAEALGEPQLEPLKPRDFILP